MFHRLEAYRSVRLVYVRVRFWKKTLRDIRLWREVCNLVQVISTFPTPILPFPDFTLQKGRHRLSKIHFSWRVDQDAFTGGLSLRAGHDHSGLCLDTAGRHFKLSRSASTGVHEKIIPKYSFIHQIVRIGFFGGRAVHFQRNCRYYRSR